MYTICWSSEKTEGWDRFSRKEDVVELIKELIKKGVSNEDILIFSNRVDYIVPEEDGSF